MPLLFAALLWTSAGPAGAAGGGANESYQAVTVHLLQAIERDKVPFMEAQKCVAAVYERLKPAPPRPQPAADRPASADCPERSVADVNAALKGAWKRFQVAQENLSRSLTSYAVALLIDRNDDQAYDDRELSDGAAALSINAKGLDRAAIAAAFNREYDLVMSGERRMDVLTEAQAALFAKGYKLTAADRAAIEGAQGVPQ